MEKKPSARTLSDSLPTRDMGPWEIAVSMPPAEFRRIYSSVSDVTPEYIFSRLSTSVATSVVVSLSLSAQPGDILSRSAIIHFMLADPAGSFAALSKHFPPFSPLPFLQGQSLASLSASVSPQSPTPSDSGVWLPPYDGVSPSVMPSLQQAASSPPQPLLASWLLSNANQPFPPAEVARTIVSVVAGMLSHPIPAQSPLDSVSAFLSSVSPHSEPIPLSVVQRFGPKHRAGLWAVACCLELSGMIDWDHPLPLSFRKGRPRAHDLPVELLAVSCGLAAKCSSSSERLTLSMSVDIPGHGDNQRHEKRL